MIEPFNVSAYLFNCTTPEAIEVGLSELVRLTDQPIGAYPNRLRIPEGWTLDNHVPTGRVDLAIKDYVNWAARLQAGGAAIIGGCCGIGPEYISALQRWRKSRVQTMATQSDGEIV